MFCEAKKKAFSGCKSQIFDIGDKNTGRGIRAEEARRRPLKQVIFIGFAPPPSRHKSQPFRTILQ